jgi:hypothetical protein
MKTFTFVSTLALALCASASLTKNNIVPENAMEWETAPQGMRIIPPLSQQPYEGAANC